MLVHRQNGGGMISGFRLKETTSLPAIVTVELCTFRNAPVFWWMIFFLRPWLALEKNGKREATLLLT